MKTVILAAFPAVNGVPSGVLTKMNSIEASAEPSGQALKMVLG
jgi:hypothetical protein